MNGMGVVSPFCFFIIELSEINHEREKNNEKMEEIFGSVYGVGYGDGADSMRREGV